MINDVISYIVFSDVHLGHRRTPTYDIISSIKHMFTSNKKWAKDLDIIYIAGDLFDRKLGLSDNDSIISVAFIVDLCKYCSVNNIKLRILEGTPDHDWKQASIIDTIVEGSSIKLDYAYIDTLSIEYIEDFDRYVLYIPDKWDTPENTYKQVLSLLKENGISKVDTSIIHGQFPFQIPYISLSSSHNESDYINITRGLIHSGHIHKHTTYKTIINQGSINRLSHGEEEDKGLLYVTGDKDNYTWKFIKNNKATIYKTIRIDTDVIVDINDIISKECLKHPTGSYIRFKTPMGSPIPGMMKELRQRHIRYHLDYIYDIPDTILVEDSKKLVPDNETEYLDLQITKENIGRLLWDKCSECLTNKTLFSIELKTVS